MTAQITETAAPDTVITRIDVAELARHAAWLIKNANTRRHSVPIMKTVNVTVSHNGMRLRSSDYEIWREAIIGTDPDDDAIQIQVDSAELARQTKNLVGTALVTVQTDRLTLALPDRILGIAIAGEVSEWPTPPAYEPTDSMMLPVAVLKRAMASIGTDATLPILSNVLVRNGYLTSTDRFRLTRENVGDESLTALLPRDLLRLFTVGIADMLVSANKTHVAVARGGQRAIATPMSLTDFPKTDELMDSAVDRNRTGIEVDRKVLLAACGGDSVDITPHSESALAVTSSSHRGGCSSAVVYVAADIGGVFPRIRLASAYLAGALKACAEDRVQLWLADSGSRPLVVRGGVTEHLVMPQRLPG